MDDFQHSHSSAQRERILNSARELVFKWVKVQLSNYIDTVEQRLFNLADNAANNEAQTGYYQARDEIKHHQDAIRPLYLKHLQQAFNNYRDNKATTTDFTTDPLQHQASGTAPVLEDKLSLVDNDTLEEQLAVVSMSRKVNADCSEALYALNQRLSVLRGGTKMNEQGNPVAPGVFGEALHIAIADLHLDNRARLIVYKVFETAFMARLNKLYDLLNHHCESNGVLPNLSYHIKKAPSEQITDQLPEELQRLTSQASMANQVDLFNAIHLLQTRLRSRAAIPEQPSTLSVPAAQIIAGIQQLQRNAGTLLNQLETPQAVAGSDISDLLKQARQQLDKTKDVDAGVIEIVGLLFEYMLNVQQLPDSVKALLSYLHTPFLKIALMDKDFFNHPEHPARQLLNSLVAAGERWVEPVGKHKSDVFQQIKSIVQRVLKEFDNDVRLFSELAFDFNHYLRQHARRIRLAEKRAMQAAQGENKLKEIRLKVEAYLKKKAGKRLLPPAIQTLLFEPWANFLCFNLLRFGSRSEQWQQAALVVDDILWYCDPQPVDSDIHVRKRLQDLQRSLPIALQAGFDTVGYDNLQGKRLLQALHDRQHITAADTTPHSTEQAAPSIDEVDASARTETAPANDALLMKLKKLELGTWFELNADSEQPQRVKLAWSNADTLHFMFVNRLGQQVAVTSGEQLAADMRSGKTKALSALEDKPFFEKAMERVLEQLKQREQNNHT